MTWIRRGEVTIEYKLSRKGNVRMAGFEWDGDPGPLFVYFCHVRDNMAQRGWNGEGIEFNLRKRERERSICGVKKTKISILPKWNNLVRSAKRVPSWASGPFRWILIALGTYFCTQTSLRSYSLWEVWKSGNTVIFQQKISKRLKNIQNNWLESADAVKWQTCISDYQLKKRMPVIDACLAD